MRESKVVLLEFNELCPPLLERWISEGLLPNFARFRSQSSAYVTETDEPEGDSLNPWIQWYSVHTGLPYSEHRVFRLTEGIRGQHADIWSVLADAGMPVANMSSMNAGWRPGRSGFYVPDPWCGEQTPSPDPLTAYHRFIARQVQAQSTGGSFGEALRFIAFMATHGLSVRTIRGVIAQLASDVFTRGRTTWKRASILDLFQFDVFRHYMKRTKPRFASFFLNSTAHYQHCYWRHMEPDRFAIKPSASELADFREAILFGYRCMDRLLEDFFELEKDGYTLILATALSQQPYLAAEERGGQRYYRPHDLGALMRKCGIADFEIEPVMAQQFVLRFPDRSRTVAAADVLRGFQMDGSQVFEVADEGDCALNVANWLHGAVGQDAILDHPTLKFAERYYDVFYQMDVMKSGRHHRDGVLWIKNGRPYAHAGKVSILEIFPTVLGLLGVPVPDPQTMPRRGLLN